MGLGVYRNIICGWSSCSVYSLLQALLGVAHTIFFQVSLVMICLSFTCLIECYNLFYIYYYQSGNLF